MITLSPDQEKAIDDVMNFLSLPVDQASEMTISGPAGSGKSYLVKYMLVRIRKELPLLTMLKNEKDELKVFLTSTTNKATDVLGEATGEKVSTIHSLLSLRVHNNWDTGMVTLRHNEMKENIKQALIIIDEAGMIDNALLESIRTYTTRCKILFIGDYYQLTPVNESISPVFTKVQKQTKLTTIQRQAANSKIILFAHGFKNAIDTGRFPIFNSYGNEVYNCTRDEFKNIIDTRFLQADTLKRDDARIIVWSNKKAIKYNNYIRKINGMTEAFNKDELVISNSPIMFLDKVIARTDAVLKIISAEPGMYHHIAGYNIVFHDGISRFQPNNQTDVINYLNQYRTRDCWPTFFREKEKFCDLRSAYACTTHKAQGSTYKEVFIDISDMGRNTKKIEIARLLYTAVTRASDHVYMYGSLPNRVYA